MSPLRQNAMNLEQADLAVKEITRRRKGGYVKSNTKLRQNIPLYLMFLPVILFYIIFKYAPMLGTVIAFQDYNFRDGFVHSPWVGLKYFHLLFSNPQTVRVIWTTLMLGALSIIVSFPFPIAIAILLNEVRTKWFKKSVQTLIYLPHFFSWVIVGGIVFTLFSQENGLINNWLQALNGEVYPFLYKSFAWIVIFLGSGVWKEAGFGAIIYLAALTSIDPSLYEASSIDGANKWKQIWHITLPGISSTIILMLILSTASVLEVSFDQIYVLQNRVVYDVSDVISTFIFRIGLQGAQFSLTTALGLFESVVALILIVAANSIARKFGQGLW